VGVCVCVCARACVCVCTPHTHDAGKERRRVGRGVDGGDLICPAALSGTAKHIHIFSCNRHSEAVPAVFFQNRPIIDVKET